MFSFIFKTFLYVLVLLALASPVYALSALGSARVSSDAFPSFTFQIPIPGINRTFSLCQTSASGKLECSGIATYITVIYQWLVGFAAVLAVLALTWGGVRWLLSGGDSGKIQEARKVIANALIGLSLALGSYLLLATLGKDFVEYKPITIRQIAPIKIELEEYKEPVSVAQSPLAADNKTYDALFKKYGDQAGIDCTFIKAMAYQEAGLHNPPANKHGATGILQVVHTQYGRPSEVDLMDPETNIKWGVGILKDAFQDGCPSTSRVTCKPPHTRLGFAGCVTPTASEWKNVVDANGTDFVPGIQYGLAAYNAGKCGANVVSANCPGKARWQCPGEIKNTITGGVDQTLKHVPRVFGHYKKMKAEGWGC